MRSKTTLRISALAATITAGLAAQAAAQGSFEPPSARQVGIVELRSQLAAGSCVDANAITGGAVLWSCHGGANQRFAYFADGTLRHAGRCLGANGSQLVLKHCEGSADTQWTLDREEVRNRRDQCIDIAGGNKANGTPLLAWECHGTTPQKWTRR